ncbi:MAG: aminomethyl transferase family protein [Candidatus Rokubacteria bacterium]|nr:aminomethyl transferase family protein [Candidatus Rokubacteria bacterium]
MARTSPLRDAFAEAGARFAAGDGVEWAAAVTAPEAEYRAVRQHVGIADGSELARIKVTGEKAREVLDALLAGNIQSLPEQAVRTTLALHEDGRILSDVTVHCFFDDYLLTAGAGAREALLGRLEAAAPDGVRVEDWSASHGMVRIDGPDAADVPRALIGLEAAGLRLMSFAECRLDGVAVMVTRVGSTGEFGYQFMAERDALAGILGRLRRLVPEAVLCGREAYDLLQLEMRSFNLRRDVPHGEAPLAAGLHWMVDFRKPAFLGRDALLGAKARGLERRMVCVRLEGGRPVPEPDATVRLDGRPVGYVAHAAWSFGLETAIGLAYLDAPVAVVGLPVAIDTSDGPAPGTTVSSPFVKTRSNTGRSR